MTDGARSKLKEASYTIRHEHACYRDTQHMNPAMQRDSCKCGAIEACDAIAAILKATEPLPMPVFSANGSGSGQG